MAAVHVAIRVWWAIMKDVFFASLAIGIHLFVKLHLIPLLNELWLLEVEVAAHLEAGRRH